MRTVWLILLIFVCLCAAASAPAQETGSMILEKCRALDQGNADKPVEVGFCAGFMTAAHEMLGVWRAGDEALSRSHYTLAEACIPPEATKGQLVKVFLKYLDDHPELLHERAILLYLTAMQKAFPCKK